MQHKGALAVRGNHDDAGLTAWESWQQGGKLKEKHKWVKDLKHRDAQWLYLRPWSLSLPTHNVAIVHAGVVPDVRPALCSLLARCAGCKQLRGPEMSVHTQSLPNSQRRAVCDRLQAKPSVQHSSRQQLGRANLRMQIALERQSLWDMYQMRGLIARSHGRWIATNSKSSKITPWATRYNGPDHVLFGHDSRKGLQVRSWLLCECTSSRDRPHCLPSACS